MKKLIWTILIAFTLTSRPLAGTAFAGQGAAKVKAHAAAKVGKSAKTAKAGKNGKLAKRAHKLAKKLHKLKHQQKLAKHGGKILQIVRDA